MRIGSVILQPRTFFKTFLCEVNKNIRQWRSQYPQLIKLIPDLKQIAKATKKIVHKEVKNAILKN